MVVVVVLVLVMVVVVMAMVMVIVVFVVVVQPCLVRAVVMVLPATTVILLRGRRLSRPRRPVRPITCGHAGRL